VLSPLVFAMLWDIDLIFGMWVYNDELQIKFTFHSRPMIFGRVMALGLWNLAKYLDSCHHFILLWFEILTWFLAWECIIISYRSTLKFVPVEWFLAKLQPLGFEICCRFLIISRFVQAILFPWINLVNLRGLEDTDLKQ
jgi:hypothetical protein